ncbi:MFS transporter [Actinocrispum wychmicini]|uniref:Putative MFS family arabinose efflux permease n=1 Tax=Actinocrispum wychmicini TaxID=1213861 RepID=A0A4R2J5L5_9PSEU|nr:MFS transporter [Actinocrispum wychmicini]TCO54191.1 putative MFS family arabinose efflux permease [Actinocrispum wychmicini]
MTIPLSRNREYRLLWTSQALSEFGINSAMIAFPLLVLTVTGSPAASGLVLGAVAAARLVAGIPAGALVDRWNRKTIMLACEVAQATAAASLVAALWWNVATIAHMVVVAIVLGICGALFEPAEDSILPNLVPEKQLSTAVSLNAARSYLGQLSGTGAGGFLFAIGRFVPFVVETVAHAIAFVELLFLRVPPREVRREPMSHLRHEMVAGLRWVWEQRYIRVFALCAISINAFFTAYYIVVIVLAQTRGIPPGEIGVMAAMLGVGGILGATIAPYLYRKLSPHVLIVMVFWVLTVLTPVAIVINSGYLMGVLFAAMALLTPSANTAITTRQLLLTPDGMRGRLAGVMAVATGVAAAVGPALGGMLMEEVSGTVAVLICTAGMAVVSVLVTISPTLRDFPELVNVGSDTPNEKGPSDG